MYAMYVCVYVKAIKTVVDFFLFSTIRLRGGGRVGDGVGGKVGDGVGGVTRNRVSRFTLTVIVFIVFISCISHRPFFSCDFRLFLNG
jgi:hypothetical protein